MIKLIRCVNDRWRYYTLDLYPTLFFDWGVQKSYGALRNKRPTRSYVLFFSTYDEAQKHVNKTMNQKIQKGYSLETNH